MERLLEDIDQLVEQTDFASLYNADERLLCLGYHVDANRRETILYDLLASEARQASFVAIALGQIPVSHWFTLGRTMTIAGGHKTLLSWSGTMFEYLMPALLMRTYRNTVWDSTYRGVVQRQREYAEVHRVPFGISESGYYAFDYDHNYQYRAFGVPGLGLDRGLERNWSWRRTPPSWRCRWLAKPVWKPFASSKNWVQRARTVFTKRLTSRYQGCRKGADMKSFRASWPTIKA